MVDIVASQPLGFDSIMGDRSYRDHAVNCGTTRSVVLILLTALSLVGCSSFDRADKNGSADESSARTTIEMTAETFNPRPPEEIALASGDESEISVPLPSAALPDGYVMEEYFVSGTAADFTPVEMASNGRWVIKPNRTATYRTRVIVRRPADRDAFSGTVVVEWFNVSALEAAPDWTYLADEIAREGHAYIGVSAQSHGVEGGKTLLDVEVDEQQAAESGVDTEHSGLKNINPQRYATLTHPGDSFSFDIFRQVGQALGESPGSLLGNLEPKQVIAAGESQSAAFMSTFVNAVHQVGPVFDSYLIHSRTSLAAPLDGNYEIIRQLRTSGGGTEFRTTIRDDLDVPVFLFVTETDLTELRFNEVRQPNNDRIRTWEVAGTAHADAHLLRSMLGGPRDPGLGAILGCGDINTGPQKEVLSAAFHHLVEWTADGTPPPTADEIRIASTDPTVLARDDHGNVLGGVRNPLIDDPVARIDGDPVVTGTESDNVCSLFGSTKAFDRSTLIDLYGSADKYVRRFRESAGSSVKAGFLLKPDADNLIAEAEANRSLF